VTRSAASGWPGLLDRHALAKPQGGPPIAFLPRVAIRVARFAAAALVLAAVTAAQASPVRAKRGWIAVSDRHQIRLPAQRGAPRPLPRAVLRRLAPADAKARGQIAERRVSFPDGEFMYAEASLGRRELGYARYKAFRGPAGDRTMLFDVVVGKPSRRQGLYGALFAHALKSLGTIDRAPILLTRGTNFDVFVRGAFNGKPGLRRASLSRISAMDDTGRRELRSRLIAAAQEMPAAKVRARHGFRRIVSIRFNPEKGTALVDFARGRATSADQVRVFVSEARRPGSVVLADISAGRAPAGPIHEIDPRGTVRPIRAPKEWRVGGYDQSRSYQFSHYSEIP
jgi:hypothetical protein